MTKGRYKVDAESSQPPRRDTSYRSFICTLLIFLVICLIILLASINWGGTKREPIVKSGAKLSQTDERETEDVDIKKSKNESFQKIRAYEETTIRSEQEKNFFQYYNQTTEKNIEEEKISNEKNFATKTHANKESSSTETNLLNKLETVGLTEFSDSTTPDHRISTTEFATISKTTQSITKNISEIITTEKPKVTSTEFSTTSIDQKPTETTTDFETETAAMNIIETENSLSTSTIKISSSSTSTTTEISIMESEQFVTEPANLKTPKSQLLPISTNPVCETSTCKKASSRMLSMMNHSAEACDDFYEFACGNFYELEEDSDYYIEQKILEEQLDGVKQSPLKFINDFKNFYESCLNFETYFDYRKRMNGLESLLNEVGNFEFNTSVSVDLTDLVSSLLLRQSMPLFDVGLDVDRQTSNLILQLNLPGQSFLRTGLDNWSGLSLVKKKCLQEQELLLRGSHINLTVVYKLLHNCIYDYSSYLDSVEAVIRDLTPFSELTADELLAQIKHIRFTIEFEVLNCLDTLPSPSIISSNFINKNYEMRRVADLQLHFPIINWKKLFETVTGHEVPENTMVQVYFVEYFKNMFKKLSNVNKIKLKHAFLAIHAHDLFTNIVIPKEANNRKTFCTELSKILLPDVWSYFVSKTALLKKEDDNERLRNLFEELKKNFCGSLLLAEWIDENTKSAIIKKCNNLNLVFSTPPDDLDNKYKTTNISANYQTNLITLLINFKRNIYATEGTPISAKTIFSYFLEPFGKKPLTFYASPLIAVPPGIMRKIPKDLPIYLQKIMVGFSLARQLARHFDPIGMTYGIKLTSTSKSSYGEFVHTMKNLMDYSSPRLFHDKNISFILNGSLSINERIVDNTAFRLIYESINFSNKEDVLPWISLQYSKEKIFFIATAQEQCKPTSMLDFMLQVFEKRHLPAVLRVENIIGNSEQFARNFQCPDGSGMDFPEKLQFPFIPLADEEYEDDNLQQSI